MAITKVTRELLSTGIDDNSNATAITIDSSERVGINEASPDLTLHVNSAASNAVAKFESTDSIAVAQFKDNNGEAEIGCVGNDIGFYPAGAEKMRLSGNNLHLNGGTDARIQLGTSGTGNAAVSNNTVHIRGDNDDMKLMAAGNGAFIFEENGSERFRIWQGGGTKTTDPDDEVYADIYSASGGNRGGGYFRFSTDGSGGSEQSVAQIYMEQGSGDGAARKCHMYFQVSDNAAPSTAMLIENNKNVKIYGTALFFPNGLGASSGNSDVNYNTSTGLITYRSSSRRYKKDIIDLDIDTTKLYDLRTVRYTDNSTEERCFGLIAEEVESVMPELVNKKVIEEGKDPVADNITYSTLSVLLLKELQSTKTRLDDALARIKTLEDA